MDTGEKNTMNPEISAHSELKVGDKFQLIGRANIFTVVRIECRDGAFGPQLVGQDSKYQTKVLAKHEGYTFERVTA
jgi:hypothetical protein